MHDRYFELRLDKKYKQIDVVSRRNSEEIIAVYQLVFHLFLRDDEQIKPTLDHVP